MSQRLDIRPLTCAALLAATVAFASLPGCGGPTLPTAAETDCTGVTTSANTCETSTAPQPMPDFPELACPTPAEIDELRREIPVVVIGDVSAGVLACRASEGSVDLTVVQNNVYQSLLFLKRLTFDRPLPWTDRSAYDWLRSVIPDGIVVDSFGLSHSCLNCLGPIHVVYSAYDHLRPTIGHLIVNLLVHEARHAQGFNHTCGFSATARAFTRDKSLAELGGYGVHYSLSYWIANYSSQPPAVREYHGTHAARLLGGGVFCCECRR
jgi:hypothetical protein